MNDENTVSTTAVRPPTVARPKTAGRNRERPVTDARSAAPPAAARPPSRLGTSSATAAPNTRRASSTMSDSSPIRPPSRSHLRTAGTGSSALTSAARFRKGIAPSTSGRAPSRGFTASAARSAAGVQPVGGVVFVPGTGTYRPVTQQGVSGARTQSRMATSQGGQRQVADRTYFAGLLNGRLHALDQEIEALTNELRTIEKARQNLLLYEHRAEEQANELKQLQSELAKLNLLIDRQNRNSDLRELEFEADEARRATLAVASVVDALFADRREKEEAVRAAQVRVREARNANAQRVRQLDPQPKNNIELLTQERNELDAAVKERQHELDTLNHNKEKLDLALANSPLKQQAMVLEEQIRELNEKKAAALKELNTEDSPEEQRQQLIDRIQKSNEEISRMQLQIQEISESIAQAQEEVREFANEFDIVASDRSERYRELRHRDVHYDAFLDAFDDAKAQIESRIWELSTEVVQKLRVISANCQRAEFAAVAIDKSIFMLGHESVEELQELHVRLQEELIAMERAETRLYAELETQRKRQVQIDNAIPALANAKTLRESAELFQQELEASKKDAQAELALIDAELARSAMTSDERERELNSFGDDDPARREFYAKLRKLKSRVDVSERERKTLRERLVALMARHDFRLIKEEALKLRADYNALICMTTR